MLVGGMTQPKSRPLDDEEPPAGTLLSDVNLSDPQVRALRIAVIVMGVMIVMGLVAVIGRIIYLMARPTAQAPVASGTLTPEVSAALPAGAQIRTVSLHGDRLAVQYDSAAGSGILVVDLASGRTLSRVRMVPSAPAP